MNPFFFQKNIIVRDLFEIEHRKCILFYIQHYCNNLLQFNYTLNRFIFILHIFL